MKFELRFPLVGIKGEAKGIPGIVALVIIVVAVVVAVLTHLP